MKNTTLFKWLTLILVSYCTITTAQENKPLTHHMSAEEQALKHTIGRNFTPTDPPTGTVHSIAEFQPMQGVMVRYPFGIPMSLVVELAEDVTLTTLVNNQSEENTVRTQYQQAGVNLEHCNFLYAPTDSYWTRDYGPWFILDGNDEFGIVDFPYNRPQRPHDDDIPIEAAEFFNVNLFGMNLIETGGNYMSDGIGIAASTDLVPEENPSINNAQIAQLAEDYLGVNPYHIIDDPLGDYIKHIDCWGKFLDVDKILISQVPESDPRYDDYEAVANFFAEATSSWGNKYQVYRVFGPGGTPATPYTNSLILNNKVFVPQSGSQWDDEALETYEAAMPGYEIIGVSYDGWLDTDALHCRTHEIADLGMLYIEHMPLLGNQPVASQYTLTANIKALSGQALYPDSVKVYYRINQGSYQQMVMTNSGDASFTATLTGLAENDVVDYYIHAADQSNRSENHPYIGGFDPHQFIVGELQAAAITLNTQSIEQTLEQGNSANSDLIITNSGNIPLTYAVTNTMTQLIPHSYSVPNSPVSYQSNTYTEAAWSDINVTNEATTKLVQINYTWSADSYPEDATFYIQAPDGTKETIATNQNSATYSKKLTQFEGKPMLGNWKIWIEDAYNDGGCKASNVTVTFYTEGNLPQWFTLSGNLNGSIAAGDTETITAQFNAAGMTPGAYEGNIVITSNDPVHPTKEVPVTLTITGEPVADITLSTYNMQIETSQQAHIDGTPLTISNNSTSEVSINSINYGLQFCFFDEEAITAPLTLSAGETIETKVFTVQVTKTSLATYLKDSITLTTNTGVHILHININDDIWDGTEENSMLSQAALYPNPAARNFTLRFNSVSSQQVNIILTDVQGRKIAQQYAVKATAGENKLIWNLPAMKNGIYFCTIEGEQGTLNQRVIIAR